jgi:uncharacterized protein (DUF433 family)
MCAKSHLVIRRYCATIPLASPGIEDIVWKKKPIREAGQELATLPSYTLPEASVFLAIPYYRLYEWYSGDKPVLVPSGHLGDMPLLSFRDLEEAYKIFLLRTKFKFSLQYLRNALSDAREKSGSEHPLLTHEIDVMNRLALVIPGRGRRKRRAITLGDKSRPDYIPEVVKTWGVRISKDRDEIYPWRYAAKDEKSTPVSLNPEVMSGRLVLTGTRIPVIMLVGRKRSGETIEEIAHDYRIDAEQVRQAIEHVERTLPKVA